MTTVALNIVDRVTVRFVDSSKPAPTIEPVTKQAAPRPPDWERLVPVSKSNDDKRLIYAVVMEPDTVDKHGDFIRKEEIEAAAHRYNIASRVVGKDHQSVAKGVSVAESYVCPVDCQIGGDAVKAGSWVVVFKVFDDDIWANRENITGVSFGGWCEKVEAEV